jgi:uncharacterized protein (UPF0276 family)
LSDFPLRTFGRCKLPLEYRCHHALHHGELRRHLYAHRFERQLQQHLQRQVLVENISAYVAWEQDELSEPAFFVELVRRTGCGLLLDVNNLVVNARNLTGCSPDEAALAAMAWVDQLPAGLVREIHLAGYTEQTGLLIDDHATRVRHEVWRVYEHALARLGPVPSLLEWDTDIPPLDVLLDEAEQARRLLVDLEDCV